MKTPIPSPVAGQKGFSLVELLMAAFVLGVGILGLTSLQVMSIRAASTSGRMQDAIRLAEQVLESASAEGTQSYLGHKFQAAAPSAMKYIGAGTVIDYYKYRDVADPEGEKGTIIAGTVDDNLFIVTVNQLQTTPAGRGQLSRFTVDVQFKEGVAADGTLVMRTVSLTRQVVHA